MQFSSRKLLVNAFVLIGTVAVSNALASGGTPFFVGTEKTKNVSLDQIDHSLWDQLLSKYVDDEGMVDYRAWKASGADTNRLDQYLRQLSSASPKVKASREAKLAFWINAYNAGTIRGILREYPTTSIRNHTAKFFGYNIWKDLKLYVGGKAFSLDAIEHEMLRKMSEPRIHFAIVCASIGCPRLLNQAFVSDRVEAQLAANASDFFSRSQNFRYDVASNRFHVSSILDWFEEDFGSSKQQMLKTISPWLPTAKAQQAAESGSVGVSYLDYNWNLNSQ